MPAYLGKYKNRASNIEKKMVRAIDSVIAQSFKDWELVIISDGCDKADAIIKEVTDERVRGFRIYKQGMFSGTVRNVGIKYAKGEYITYLDVDDVFGKDHLQIINNQLNGEDWVWYNDRSWDAGLNDFAIHQINIDKVGQGGTSNVTHKRELGAWWTEKMTYMQDWIFIVSLKKASQDYKYLEETPYYNICHVPSLLDV